MPSDPDRPSDRPGVLLASADPDLAAAAAQAASAAAGDVDAAIRVARGLGSSVPGPGGGRTADYLAVLASVGAADLTVARVVEPHLDALAILDQAGVDAEDGVYGVYAAERGGLDPVRAEASESGTVLHGTKPWCSLGGRLDRALVTAVEGDERRLFAIDLHHPGVTAQPGTWISRGLAAVDSGDLVLDAVPAIPVGAARWYLDRPGFAWGGIGVAACWYGAAAAVAAALLRAAAVRAPDQLAHAAIGEADRLLWAALRVLEDAAVRIDTDRAEGAEGALLADRVRGVVATAAERVLTVVGRALGPAPLAFDESHARRVADLTLYLRQHHAERDDAAAGAAVLASGTSWA